MKKILYNKYDKKKIGDLPRALFPGRINVILTPGEAERAVDYLLTSDILGFDTETRPVFSRGRQNKVALLQVSNKTTCFLFRLNRIGLCPAIIRLLESTQCPKIGLSWHDDVRSLHQRGEFEPRGFVDLQDHMKELGIQDLSLAKLYANVFGQRISKREQLSNWEADVLSQRQKDYAATDAWACIMLYEEYLRLKDTGDFYLEVVPEPVPESKPVVETEAQPQEPSASIEEQETSGKADSEPKSKASKRTSRKPKRTTAKSKPRTSKTKDSQPTTKAK